MNAPRRMGVQPHFRFDEDADQRPPSNDSVSPELALVDPVLAARLRSQLLPPWAEVPGWPVDEPPREHALPDESDEPGVAPDTEIPAAEERHHVPAPTRPRRGRERSSVPTGVAVGLAAASALASAVTAVLLMRAPAEPPTRSTAAPVRHTPIQHTAARQTVESTPRTVRRQPVRAPTVRIVRTLAWAPVSGAGSYEIQLFRGSRRVFLTRKRETRLVVGPSWRYAGETFRLVPGTYRWYVWPVAASGARRKEPLVQALVQIARS